jgi:hypothetical protein
MTTEPFVSVYYNKILRAWIVLKAEDKPGPLRWEPLFDSSNWDEATAYAMTLRKLYRSRYTVYERRRP